MDSKVYEPRVLDRSTGSSDRVLIGLILLVALLYRLYGLTGDISYDPAVYAQYAHNLLDGTFRLDTDCWYALRLPVFVPVAFAYAVLGVGTISTCVWPLLLSILQIGAVLWLGYRWLGREVAILAACFLTLLPLDVIYAGVLGPDEVIAAFVTFAVAFWVGALEGRERPSRILLFLSGLFLALATITRPYALLVAFFFAGYAFWRRASISKLLWWCVGVVGVAVPVLVLYAVVTGDPLRSMRAISGFYGAPERSGGTRLLSYPALVWRINSETGLFAFLFSVTAIVALLRPTRQRLVLLSWIAPILIYLQFGSMSLDSYVPVFKRIRFLTPLLAPAAFLAALVILEKMPLILRKLRIFSDAARASRFLLMGLIIILCANSLWIVGSFRSAHTQVATNFKRTVAVLRSDREIPVLFDHWRTAIRFEYYFDFKEGSHLYEGADETVRMNRERAEKNSRLGYLKWYENPADLPDGFIVLDDVILAQAAQAAIGDPSRSKFPAKDIPSYCHNPPASWELLGRFGTLRVFRTHKKEP
jgi:4-amino-4-deoxy-L-arabinose transferase-like glycosyltransferase